MTPVGGSGRDDADSSGSGCTGAQANPLGRLAEPNQRGARIRATAGHLSA